MVLVVGSPKERGKSSQGAAAQLRVNSGMNEQLRLLKCSAGYMVFAVKCKLLRTESLSLLLYSSSVK